MAGLVKRGTLFLTGSALGLALGAFPVSASAQDAPPPEAMVEGNTSDIQSWGFAVSVAAGQSVAWTNMGSQAHSVTSTGGTFDTGLLAPGSSAPVEFDTPGLFPYVCTPHPWMKGAVTVS
jgi:plastocyanin